MKHIKEYTKKLLRDETCDSCGYKYVCKESEKNTCNSYINIEKTLYAAIVKKIKEVGGVSINNLEKVYTEVCNEQIQNTIRNLKERSFLCT